MDASHISILPNEMLMHVTTFLTDSAAFMLKCTARAFAPFVRARVNPDFHYEPVQRPALWMAYKDNELALVAWLEDEGLANYALDTVVDSHLFEAPHCLHEALVIAVNVHARETTYARLFIRVEHQHCKWLLHDMIGAAVAHVNQDLLKRFLMDDWSDPTATVDHLGSALYAASYTSYTVTATLLSWFDHDPALRTLVDTHRTALLEEILHGNASGRWDTWIDGAMELVLVWCWTTFPGVAQKRHDFIVAAMTRHCSTAFITHTFNLPSLQSYVYCANHACVGNRGQCRRSLAILPYVSEARFDELLANGRHPCSWVLAKWEHIPGYQGIAGRLAALRVRMTRQ